MIIVLYQKLRDVQQEQNETIFLQVITSFDYDSMQVTDEGYFRHLLVSLAFSGLFLVLRLAAQ